MKIQYYKKSIWAMISLFILTIIACNNKSQGLSKRDSEIIQKYLEEQVLQPSFDGKVFSSFKLFKKEDNYIYIWAYMQEYYKKDNKIESGSGWSVPMVIYFFETPSEVRIKNLFTPKDGDMYTKGIHTHFPEEIQKQILGFQGTQEILDLENSCKEEAEKFYK
jgi:hypothetical protein